MEIESKQPRRKATGFQRGRQILERRKEIEQNLVDMLKETESDFTLDHVRDVIFYEEDNDDMIHPIGYDLSNGVKVVAMFDRDGDASELSNILKLVTDAWNYFPHNILGDISPADLPAEASAQAGKLLEYHEKKSS